MERRECGLIGLACCLFIPSTGQVDKYLGTPGVVIYLVVASLILILVHQRVTPWFVTCISERRTNWLAAATLLALILIFTAVYPVVDAGGVDGGSDRDDALNLATAELLGGRYPYAQPTYLGNPISPLPGSLLLAVPFVALLGNSAYQNFFWLAAFFLVARWWLKDARLALFLLWLILALSPVVLQELVTGGDLLANSLYVLIFTLLTAHLVPQAGLSGWKKALPAVFLGIGLASRANYLLVLSLLYSLLVQRAGWMPATKYLALTSLTFGAIVLPFWLHDPSGFSPLHTANKLARFASVLPQAGVILPVAAGLITLALSIPFINRTSVDLLRNCAIVQAFPVVSAVALSTVQLGRLDFTDAGFGFNFLFFGALAFWTKLATPE